MFLYSCSTFLDAFIIWWVKPHYFPFSLQFTFVFSKTMDFGSIAFPDIQILFNASWYSSFTNSNFCLSDEFLQSNLHNDISNLFRISDGWFDNISQQLGVILLSVRTICVRPYVKCNINKVNFFKIGIHSIQVWTATRRSL